MIRPSLSNPAHLAYAPLKIVAVEDQASTLDIIERTVRGIGGHISFHGFGSAESALQFVEETTPDVLILDVHLSGMDGIEFARRFRKYPPHLRVPVLFLTGDARNEMRFEALQLGAVDYLLKPVQPRELELKVQSLISVINAAAQTDSGAAAEAVSAGIAFASSTELPMRSVLMEVLRCLPHRPAGNEARVAQLATFLAGHTCLSTQEQMHLTLACSLRNIGYVSVPSSILGRWERMTDDERERFRGHAAAGHALLTRATPPLPSVYALVARHHHERHDGRGYPDGLRGDEIPLCARIVALADRYDELRSARGYRKALTHDEAREWIFRQRDKAFDPVLVDTLLDASQLESSITE